MTTEKKPNIGIMILAFVILIAGGSFGLVNMANGVRVYKDRATESQIQQMESYLELMWDLEDILADSPSLESFDADSYLDRKLQNYDLTQSQERNIRELYAETIQKASGSALDWDMAMNSLTREIIYYRQTIPNPAHDVSYLRNMLIIGGGSLLLSLAIFAGLMKKSRE